MAAWKTPAEATDAPVPADLAELGWLLAQLQCQAVRLALPGLLLAGLLILGFPARFRDPTFGEWTGIALWLLAGAVWGLQRLDSLASAWLLSVGCLAALLAIAGPGGVWPVIFLLMLPVGIAALAVSLPASVAVAAACTVFLFRAPAIWVPSDIVLRLVALVALWSTLGLIWLTLRPLLTALQWAWSSSEQSRRQLDRARDYQVQLKQTLKDLADANLQLTRLNHLAQALRQAAEEARRAKEEFVANVSHELRTPLNMIVGFSEMITQAPEAYGSGVPKALLADLAIILRNSRHLSSLIEDVLDLSQIEAGQMALTKERAALGEIVEAAMEAVRPLFESKGLYLKTEVQGGLSAYCDRTRIREVLLNLLSNAGRFTERGGVRVRAWQEAGDVVVSVADTGPGIATEDKGKLFRPFQQLDGSVRRRYGGTGLGLSISKSFVELHGGKMWLESEIGSGTTFFFRLPIDPPAPLTGSVTRWLHPNWEYEGRTERPAFQAPVVRPRLVVLEAGETLHRLLSRYLHDLDVVPAATLEEALQELSRAPAQALLVNGTSVGDALQRLSAADLPYHTPAIVCSVPDVSHAAGVLGVSDYLVKPVLREELLTALDRLHLQGKTVLIVDDETEAIRLFRRMLVSAGRGYRVLRATNGRQALDIMRAHRPAAVFLDLVMPEMDGFRLLAEKSSDPVLRDIPVVVVSARDPSGQPIVSSGLAVTKAGGLSMPQFLSCVEALSRLLSLAAPAGGPASRSAPAG